MMLQIPEVLTKAQVAECRAILDAGPWVDGNLTSGFQAARAKTNEQLPQDVFERHFVQAGLLSGVGRGRPATGCPAGNGRFTPLSFNWQ